MTKKCPLCNSDEFQILYDFRNPPIDANNGLPGIIRECKNCSLLYKDFDKAISEVYSNTYADAFVGLKDYAESNVSKLFFRKILSKAKSRIKGNEKPVLLDVGAAMGTTMDIAKELGFQTKGVEISTMLANKAKEKGHEVFNCNISEISSSEKFDVITMFDIIEHLDNPKEVLLNLKKMLKPKGEIIVYTPNHGSLIVKIGHLLYKLGFPNSAVNIFACTHTCFFTTDTLKNILNTSGFGIKEIVQFKYDTSRPGQEISTSEKVAVNLIENIGSLLGYKGFRVVIYASNN